MVAYLSIFSKLFLFIIITIQYIKTKVWSPDKLANQMSDWNTLVDPESLIGDYYMFTKIYNNYLKKNKIYDKTNVNIFVISQITDQYTHNYNEYGRLLIKNIMENNTPYDNGKYSNLFIIFAFEQNILIIIPSVKLEKYLSNDIIISITNELVSIIKMKNHIQSIIYLFERLDIHWHKFSKGIESNDYKIKSNDTYSFIISFITLTVIILGYFIKKVSIKKESKNFNLNKLKLEKNCPICFDELIIAKNKENIYLYEYICIENLDREINIISVMNCNHVFHASCIDNWVNECSKNQIFDILCPICRRNDLEKIKDISHNIESVNVNNSLLDESSIVYERSYQDHLNSD